ncbi:hypothetical protein AMECASPLE_014178 [Ameca splendens]|uniref:Uncharacterized protein n=1 Tax=Ameca splendens TaxID=208324 RepID=A0ABV1A8P8_9TELE
MAAAVGSGSVSSGLRAMFFMLTPNESSFQKVEEVPQYVQQETSCVHLIPSLVETKTLACKDPNLPDPMWNSAHR